MKDPHNHTRAGETILTVRIDGTAYGWDERLDAASLSLRATRDRAILLVNLSAFTVCVLSAALGVVLVFWLGSPRLLDLASWLAPSWAGLLFSISLIFGCFLFYRIIESARARVFVPRIGRDAIVPSVETCAEGEKVQNVAKVFDLDAFKAVEEAYTLAKRYGHAELTPLHLFIGSLSTGQASVALLRMDISFADLKSAFERRLSMQQLGPDTAFSPVAEETLLSSFTNAYLHGRRSVGGLELFEESFNRDPWLQELFLDKKAPKEAVENVMAWIRVNAKMRERYEQFRRAAGFKPTGPMNRTMTSTATPTLDAFSEDLTAAAVRGQMPLLVGRDREVEAAFRVMEGGRKSVLFVGPNGTGRTSILAGLAELMVEERVPKVLQDKRLVSLSIPHLLSGAGPAEAQERLLTIIIEISRARNIVLAIPDLELLAQNSMGSDLSALLVDALSRGITYAVSTTTTEAYAGVIERSLLSRAFEKVDVPEPGIQDAIRILESKIGVIEYEHKVVFTYAAAEAAVKLTDRYQHDSFLPQKAIAACRETARDVAKARGADARVTAEDIAKVVSEKTGVPLTNVTQSEQSTLLNLETTMQGRVIGQAEAVKAVAAALRRARTQLKSDKRPIATFLFLGPTGVGKTELAKTIAATYFGNEAAMLRFDMSEYQEQGSIERLIGTSRQGSGLLTEAVRRQPFSIVLLDEFEKAHPDILNLFLQVFDDGRLTDGQGRTVDFTSTILVATSNAGTPYIQQATTANASLESIKTHLMETELRGIYRPELLNRFDGVIVFRPLTRDDVIQISYLLVNEVAKRLEPKGIRLRATDEAVMELAEKGYDPLFGARPLRRVIQEQVDNSIANALLEGKIQRRDTVVLLPGGKIDIEKGEAL